MIKVTLLIVFITWISNPLYSQIVNDTLIQKRGELNPRVKSIVTEIDFDNINYINFTVGEDFTFIIAELDTAYIEVYVTVLDDSYSKRHNSLSETGKFYFKKGHKKVFRVIPKPNTAFKDLFETTNYLEGFTTTKSQFYEKYPPFIDIHGDFTYFFVKKNENIYGESFLPLWIENRPFPFPDYLYFFKSVLRNVDF